MVPGVTLQRIRGLEDRFEKKNQRTRQPKSEDERDWRDEENGDQTANYHGSNWYPKEESGEKGTQIISQDILGPFPVLK